MEVNRFISRKRIFFLALIATVLVIVILVQYGKHMLMPKPDPIQPKITVERGSILDRNGKLLAVQNTLYNIAITRSTIQDKAVFASLLSPVCDIPEQTLLERLSASGSDFFYLKKKISESEKSAIAETVHRGKLRGIISTTATAIQSIMHKPMDLPVEMMW